MLEDLSVAIKITKKAWPFVKSLSPFRKRSQLEIAANRDREITEFVRARIGRHHAGSFQDVEAIGPVLDACGISRIISDQRHVFIESGTAVAEYLRHLTVTRPPTNSIVVSTNSALVDVLVDRDRLKVGLKKLVDSIPQRGAACPVPHGDCVPDALTVTLARICDLALEPTAPDEGLRNGKVILGMVSIQGEVHWSVTLGFTPDSASAIATRFAGYDIPSEGPDLGDAIGEITNIVAGRIKHNLGGRGLAANISLPTVFGADSLQMLLERDNAMAYAYFDSPVGKLWTLVSVGIDSGVIL